MAPPFRMRLAAACVAAAAVVAVAAGCGDDVSGSVTVSGSSTLLPLASSVAGNFAAQYPLARVHLEMAGTGAGLAALCDGTVAVAGASRTMSDREATACTQAGIRPVRLELARDALVFFTRKSSPAPECLSTGDVYALMGPEAVGTRRWRQVATVAHAVGGSARLPDAPLVVVVPEGGSGTRQMVEDSVIGPIARKRSQQAGIRPDALTVPSDQVMLSEVLKAPAAVAFAGYATVRPWGASVRPIAVNAGSGCVAPSEQSIRDGSYPLARSLYLYVDPEAARRNATAAAFTTAMVQGATRAGEGAGVIALDAQRAGATTQAWDAALSDGDVTGT